MKSRNDTAFDVTVNSITGTGTLSIDVLAAAAILDVIGNDLNTSFTTGAAYDIDNSGPQVQSIALLVRMKSMAYSMMCASFRTGTLRSPKYGSVAAPEFG